MIFTCSANAVGHADRRVGQLARFAARVARLDLLNAALDFADVLEIVLQPLRVAALELLASGCVTCAVIQSRMLLSALPIGGALLGRRADTEQLIEHHARIAHHRHAASSGDDQLIVSV